MEFWNRQMISVKKTGQIQIRSLVQLRLYQCSLPGFNSCRMVQGYKEEKNGNSVLFLPIFCKSKIQKLFLTIVGLRFITTAMAKSCNCFFLHPKVLELSYDISF